MTDHPLLFFLPTGTRSHPNQPKKRNNLLARRRKGPQPSIEELLRRPRQETRYQPARKSVNIIVHGECNLMFIIYLSYWLHTYIHHVYLFVDIHTLPHSPPIYLSTTYLLHTYINACKAPRENIEYKARYAHFPVPSLPISLSSSSLSSPYPHPFLPFTIDTRLIGLAFLFSINFVTHRIQESESESESKPETKTNYTYIHTYITHNFHLSFLLPHFSHLVGFFFFHVLCVHVCCATYLFTHIPSKNAY